MPIRSSSSLGFHGGALACCLLLACSGSQTNPGTAYPLADQEQAATGEAAVADVQPPEPAPVVCDERVTVYRDGQPDGDLCPQELAENELTVIDLSDDWAPYIFSEDESAGAAGTQPYRDTFVALADERLGDVSNSLDKELYLELFGIFPTFRVLRERLADEERHTCHEAVDDSGLPLLDRTIRPRSATRAQQRSRARQVARARRQLQEAADERGITDFAELADDPRLARTLARYERFRPAVDATIAAQGHLECDGLFSTRQRRRMEAGVFDWHTAAPLAVYQRRHMIVAAGALTEESRRVLGTNSRELDYHAVLRTLRERVIDATGLLEDGSASRSWGEVMGMSLDAPEFRFEAGQPAADNGAPDLISPAVQAAAEALGFADAATTLAAIDRMRGAGHEQVAVPLPALPAYHSEHMNIRAEIDRGDVWYRFPYTEDGRRRGGRVVQRPIITLYAQDGDREVALVRWPTTIGGWKPELNPEGGTGLKYKESYTGERVWRDVIAAPAWLPPPATPDEDLLRTVRGERVPNYGLFGPGYRSAYGLALLLHHQVQDPRDPEADPETEAGQPRFIDQGIRVHGSVSYRSITNGTSHGCHRLYNHLAVRLSSFVLRHRHFTRQGSISVRYRREIDEELTFEIRSRGYRFELTPPVPINVLEGRVRGGVRRPIRAFMPLREELVAAEAAESGESATPTAGPGTPAPTVVPSE